MRYLKNIIKFFVLVIFNRKMISSKIFSSKKSDILFILGSGNSINNIDNWEDIRKHDSLGFNYFLFHKFVPNIFVIESTYPALEKEYTAQLNLIKKKKSYLKKSDLYLKINNGYNKIKKILDENSVKYKLIYELNFNSKNINELNIQINKKLNNLLKSFFFLGQGTASIERFCLNAYYAGYKKIVLCGVDLNNKKYFFDDTANLPDNLKKISKDILKSKSTAHSNELHTTSDPKLCKSGITVQEVLKVYQNFFFKSKCQIYVLNKKSLLAKYFPVY